MGVVLWGIADDLVHGVLIYELLLDLMGAWIVLVLVLGEWKTTLYGVWVLHVSFGSHESYWALLLRCLHTVDIVGSHQLLRIDHRKNTILSFFHRHNHRVGRLPDNRIAHTILILQQSLRARVHRVARGLHLIILLKRMEHLFLPMVERATILLLILGRDSIH